MARYTYPAIFTSEEKGRYSVYFPDLEGCYTCGDDINDALFMGEDALAMTLYNYENEAKAIPKASSFDDISLNDGEFVNYIACDTLKYRKQHNSKAIKKTLTIPEWLNNAAIEKNVNFSKVLQDALIDIVSV